MVEKKTPVGKPADDFIRIQDLWSMFVPKWYWFAISLFITLTIAVLYLLSTPPIYTRTAAILVKDNSKSSSSTGAMSDFSDLGIFKSNQHQQRVADIKVAHTDDRGSQPVGVERNLYHPQRIKERRFVQSISCHHYILRQNRSAIKFHHQVLFKRGVCHLRT